MTSHPDVTRAIALSQQGLNDEAVALIRQTATNRDPEALYILGEMTWRGGMVDQDPARARTLFEYSGSLGNAAGNIFTTNLLASGVAGKQDWAQAIARLEAEARAIPERRRIYKLLRAMKLDRNGDPLELAGPKRLSESPRVSLFSGLLTSDECDYLLDVVEGQFQPSLVYDAERNLVRDEIRTSDGAAIHWLIEDPAVVALNRRIAAATGTAYEHGEALALLRYEPGQQYRPHFDFVDGAENRRLKTALLYLNDGYEGGETAFVRTGLKVAGKKGDMLLFDNDSQSTGPDLMSEHEGRPVTSGIKYLATRWIREARVIP